ncbi:hypothetical protein N0V83_004678 [Neocucurbitaria cava]|uniref:DUF7730 domain-containing protein n=1 Tax=Neocucurbitaria cava TaxID=798079 RepID=A0A9W9CN77_9PLEO|nr:hypothetical protein N0V83_004678 [Neocucurbitaria cava]
MDSHNEDTGVGKEECSVNKEAECSRLLSLPKELRLEIWRYVLTDPSLDQRVLRIDRKLPNSSSTRRYSHSLSKDGQKLPPPIKTAFEEPHAAPTNVNLLRTNWLIYEEALPILYHSVTFCPWAFAGFFGIFLDKLSPFARSHIRYIKLYIGDEAARSLLSWAITCAQVAQLSDGLRSVQLEGRWLLSPRSKSSRERLLYPLLKIKAPKEFIGVRRVEFQRALDEAAKELEAKTLVRKACTAVDAMARVKQGEPPSKWLCLQEVAFRANPLPIDGLPGAGEGDAVQDLSTSSGVQSFEKDLEEWDIVSVRSASPNRKRDRAESISDEENWVGGGPGPTIVVRDGGHIKDNESDWEFIDETALSL